MSEIKEVTLSKKLSEVFTSVLLSKEAIDKGFVVTKIELDRQLNSLNDVLSGKIIIEEGER